MPEAMLSRSSCCRFATIPENVVEQCLIGQALLRSRNECFIDPVDLPTQRSLSYT